MLKQKRKLLERCQPRHYPQTEARAPVIRLRRRNGASESSQHSQHTVAKLSRIGVEQWSRDRRIERRSAMQIRNAVERCGMHARQTMALKTAYHVARDREEHVGPIVVRGPRRVVEGLMCDTNQVAPAQRIED